MANITLSIPEDMHKEISRHPEIKWSEIVRQAFNKKIKELYWVDVLLSKSELTEEDAERIGHKIKSKIGKRISK
mgnify:CR=1 FL=1